MQQKKLVRFAVIGVLLMWAVIFATRSGQPIFGVEGVRGKSPALPVSGPLTPEDTLAQDLALSDPRVQDLTVGKRSEVFGVSDPGYHVPESSKACYEANCRSVIIYLWDEDITITAIVDVDTREVLDVLQLIGNHPGLNVKYMARAAEIIYNTPEVAAQLGYQPKLEDIMPMDGNLLGTSCGDTHLCASATFRIGDRFMWAAADLTTDTFAGIGWSPAPENDGSSTLYVPEGCPPSGSVTRDGWSLQHEVTGTDSMRVFNVSYNGVPVMTSVKVVEQHADYGSSGYQDSTGCGGGGGGFPIYPYGDTVILDLLDENTNVIGFEVVQDFRMGSWGNSCNYRYDQRIQFFTDGRFRVVSSAYGKGCGTNATYRPVVRMDLAINGDDNDNFAYYDGTQWVDVTTETYRVPYTETGHGPHYIDENGYSWKVYDTDGTGYYIEQDVGQFLNGRGDNPFLYPVLHHANEGDTDLPVFSSGCCNDNHMQGPHLYLNNENIVNQNIVLWYVPQAVTDAVAPDYYCWTLQGEPNPVTYPCFMGPMFHPIANTPMGTTAGTISLQGRTDFTGAVVTASNGINQYTADTDTVGNFSLPLPVGTYQFSVEMPGYLDAVISGIEVTEGNTTNLPAVTLLGGDTNDSDKINILDLALIGSHYGLQCSDNGWDARADVNADCVVDLLDLTIAAGNFQMTSPVPWSLE
ncbi:MAG: carboxypeptidase regulatory-like domain-containing protein [Anaerolineales bacterium]|nr:carboxypeptidase regulatory-like domain-containing protein [Anaerolineales bacterium]